MNDNTPRKTTHHKGRAIDAIQWVVSGSPDFADLAGEECEIDDRVQLLCIYTVVGVGFKIDSKTGNLVKIQSLKPVEMHLMPFDENDPTDDGILRATLPGVAVSSVPALSAGDSATAGDDS